MKWLRNILKGASLTAALFVFQACYGTPPAMPVPPDTEDLALNTEDSEDQTEEEVTEETLSQE